MRPFLLLPDPRIGTWSFLRLIDGGVPPASPERLALAGRLALFPLPAGFPIDKSGKIQRPPASRIRKDLMTLS
jgi:hypothetical protein